ncbi:MAG: ABC transporter permease, partial [Promethearchaeota archaeon]
LVGTQITTETLKNYFRTNLLIQEGEIDLQIMNATLGGHLRAADKEIISQLVPGAVGVMPQLETTGPVSFGSQYEPYVDIAGVEIDYDSDFGLFYDWKTENEMNISNYLLIDNRSVILSSKIAEYLDLTKDIQLPITIRTNFKEAYMTNITYAGENITVVQYKNIPVELSVEGIYDSNRPGIGAQHGDGLVMEFGHLQSYISWALFGQTDVIDSFAVAFKTNHFQSQISKGELETHIETVRAKIKEDNLSYQVLSIRLIMIEIIDLIFDFVNAFLTVLGVLIVATGLLLITNIQLLAVEDKEFQTGVLRAVGAKRFDIFNIYLIEAVFQGILGGFFGLFGGIIFGWTIAYFVAEFWGVGGGAVAPVIKPLLVFLAIILGILLAIITGILPSIRAARVNVVEALRGVKTKFSERISRNYFYLGIFLLIVGIFVLLQNGVFNRDLQYFWEVKKGYDSLKEWENILLATGILAIGFGIVLTRYSDPVKAGNVTGIILWSVPCFVYLEGLSWIEVMVGNPTNMLLISVLELVAGSVILVGLNLPPVMNSLRYFLSRIPNFEGVSQIAPAMISSHKARSTLTFAIFGVILTLNVTIATMVATQSGTMIQDAEDDARGVDIVVNLDSPEVADFSYAEELYRVDERIQDVIPFRSRDYINIGGLDIISLVYLKDPYSPDFDINMDILPLRMVEAKSEQIRGNATDATDPNWRYDYYLQSFPDGIREQAKLTADDSEKLDYSRQAWDKFFDANFEMTAYNTTKYLESHFSFGGFGSTNEITMDYALRFNESDPQSPIINNSVIFTDSFLLSLGRQVWLYMGLAIVNDTTIPLYQPFTVAGILDSERGAGFPVGSVETGGFTEQRADVMGSVLIPEHIANQTSFFGPTAETGPEQFNSFLVKTALEIDDPEVQNIAQKIEEYTNVDGNGYRKITNQNLTTAIAITIFSVIEANLKAMQQMTDMLEVYVSVGLILGATGMAVISIRNVTERKREIGMMRAIGFPRSQVILSVLMELFVLGIIGLGIGILNGLLINVGFASVGDSTLFIPWNRLALYLGFVSFIAFISGVIPGWKASRIPPSEALRYVG